MHSADPGVKVDVTPGQTLDEWHELLEYIHSPNEQNAVDAPATPAGVQMGVDMAELVREVTAELVAKYVTPFEDSQMDMTPQKSSVYPGMSFIPLKPNKPRGPTFF